MKKSVFFIFLFLVSLAIFARKDSTKLVNFRGFYVNTYYPQRLFAHYNQVDKYSTDYYSQFELKNYQFQSPGIGFGYVLSRNALFIKTDFNYWYGTKNINDNFSFISEDKNSQGPYSTGHYSTQNAEIGYRYYRVKDHYVGTLNLHYFDIGFAITGNITRFLRLYSGWRINYLLKYSYQAKIERNASLYEVERYTSQSYRVDSLIQAENLTYQNQEVKKKSIQEMQTFLFFNFGLNTNFRIKKQLFFIDLAYESNHIQPTQEGVIVNCFTFKLAYVFKYSNDLGTD